MAVFVVQAALYFDGADDSDALAEGRAQAVHDFLEAVQGQGVFGGGSEAERNGFAVMQRVDGGVTTTVDAWHVSTGGALTQGLPGDDPVTVVDEWVGTAMYEIGDEVIYLGVTYRRLQAMAVPEPQWPPSAVPALWAVV
ncbi:MAG: carbohydrate-binding protein [Actinomycetota bacterium]